MGRSPGKSAKPYQPWALEDAQAVRRMYVIEGKPLKTISATLGARIGRSYQDLANLCTKHGWSQERRTLLAQQDESAIAEIKARQAAEVERVVEATAQLAEEASTKGLRQAIASADAGQARDFRMWAGGARDLVTVARASRGLDQRTLEGSSNGQTIALSVFCVSALPKPASEPINVTASAPRAAELLGE